MAHACVSWVASCWLVSTGSSSLLSSVSAYGLLLVHLAMGLARVGGECSGPLSTRCRLLGAAEAYVVAPLEVCPGLAWGRGQEGWMAPLEVHWAPLELLQGLALQCRSVEWSGVFRLP